MAPTTTVATARRTHYPAPMTRRLPIGISDFGIIRRGNYVYVDKTRLIGELIDTGAQALLLPRPRRFGKTLNLSMMKHFFEQNGSGPAHDPSGDGGSESGLDSAHDSASDREPDLFEGLWAAEDAPDEVQAHRGAHPVVFLTFKDVKASTFDGCMEAVRDLIAAEVNRHADSLLGSGRLDDRARERLDRLRRGTGSPTATGNALRDLTQWLGAASGRSVVLLIDEYDTPIHAGYVHGYYDEVIELFRNLLSGGLKDNSHLFKGVLTGILRVAKESIFSGLNNLGVYSILMPEFATAFGFTEAEVEEVLSAVGRGELLPTVRDWYNGYRFGEEVIYNPWSVNRFAASKDAKPLAYWVQTSSNDLVRELLIESGADVTRSIEALLRDERVRQPISENIALRDIGRRDDALWSLLLFSGYLKPIDVQLEAGEYVAELCVPNKEVRYSYTSIFAGWLREHLRSKNKVHALGDALVSGNADTVEELLGDLMRDTLSYHDLGGREPERVYHAFVVGLLVHMEADYDVRSNRESGFGRCDVMLIPRREGEPGCVLELKSIDVKRDEDVEGALESALAQIRDRDYVSEVRARGADPVHEIAAVFDGKHVWTRLAGDSD